MKEIPNHLYKYRTFDPNNYYENLISKNELFFSAPNKFNDPFDCKYVPNYDIGTDKDIFKIILKYAEIDNPNYSKQGQLKIAQKNFKDNIHILRNPVLFSIRINETMNNMFGICSFSEDKSNLLMWAHYSNCHEGFCVEYNAHLFEKICLNYARINESILFERVKYLKDFPLFNPDMTMDPNYLKDYIITKSPDWEYEKEWRLIYEPNSKLTFPDDIMTSIYFGVNCSETNIEKVRILIQNKRNKPKLFKAILKRYEFGIEYQEIN
jgi:hypothetical protein